MNWLLQNTERPKGIQWQRREYGMYFTELNEGPSSVRVSLGSVQGRPASRIIIRFTSPGLGIIDICEPFQKVFSFRKKYDSIDDGELAGNMGRLLAIVANQSIQRELNEMKTEEERRQAIYNRLTGGIT
ncbi:MAG: hypothetical protein Q7S43_03195 [bacterium]|nr:hypothetical protein [bacterium]MDO8496435.1 hypothetical protein [bacterium]